MRWAGDSNVLPLHFVSLLLGSVAIAAAGCSKAPQTSSAVANAPAANGHAVLPDDLPRLYTVTSLGGPFVLGLQLVDLYGNGTYYAGFDYPDIVDDLMEITDVTSCGSDCTLLTLGSASRTLQIQHPDTPNLYIDFQNGVGSFALVPPRMTVLYGVPRYPFPSFLPKAGDCFGMYVYLGGGDPSDADQDEVFLLATSAAGDGFYADSRCTVPTTTVTIRGATENHGGDSSATFYYRGGPGTPTITATSKSHHFAPWQQAVVQITGPGSF